MTFGDKYPIGMNLLVKRRWIMILVLFIILLVLAIGTTPAWPYSRGWGYYPSGGIGTILLILLLLWLLGVI